MTKSLQDLIDEAIFISTEHQAVLAELTGDSDWTVDFSAPSFALQSDPSVALTPYLLGTESEQRGSWIWSWQELGHFPDSVVRAAVQTREFGTEHDVQELTTDELVLSEGLARRLTLAAKTATGLYAHYPAPAGGGVRAWLLLEGPQFELPEPTVQRMGRVMAEALQTGTAVHHQRAVDSYARLRGAHIAWDTEACAVITASDGALRLWFDGNELTGVETAEPAVGNRELAQAAKGAQKHREELRKEGQRALKIAAREAAEQRRAREEAEARRIAETEAALAGGGQAGQSPVENYEQPVPAAFEADEVEEGRRPFAAEETYSQDDRFAAAETPSVSSDGVEPTRFDDGDRPFDQDPREDAEPGLVSTHVVSGDETEERPFQDARYYEDEQRASREGRAAHEEQARAEREHAEQEELQRRRRLEQEHEDRERAALEQHAAERDFSEQERAEALGHDETDAAPAYSAAPSPEDAVTEEHPVVDADSSRESEHEGSALDRLRSGRPEQDAVRHEDRDHRAAPQDAEQSWTEEDEQRPQYGEYEDERREQRREQQEEGKKKGFFSRFFGL